MAADTKFKATTSPWATKYRPMKFKDVAGQESVLSELKGMLSAGEVPNAILLEGPYGSGKTTLARLFARYVNCETGKACGKCRSCMSNPHPDVTELDGAENRGIDDVRSLIGKSRMRPIHNIRFFILDEIHQLTPQASQAILKSLEEPGSTTCYILCTNEPHKLLDTVISRCTRLSITLPNREQMIERLCNVLEIEKAKLDKKVLSAIVEASGGHMRDALTITQSAVRMQKAGKLDVDAIASTILNQSKTSALIATKMLLGLYMEKKGATVSAILDLQTSGEQAIPFLNMALRWNEYAIAMTVKNDGVWHTPDHKEFWSRIQKMEGGAPKLSAMLRVEAALADVRGKLQYSGVPERSVLLAALHKESSS